MYFFQAFLFLACWTDHSFTLSFQVISIAMDMFTDIDIFKEVVDASIRGVPVYILLDEFHLKSFLTMAESQDVKIQQLRVSMRFNPLDSLNLILKCNTITGFYKANMQLFLFGVVELFYC